MTAIDREAIRARANVVIAERRKGYPSATMTIEPEIALALLALVPEPPTDDEREALAQIAEPIVREFAEDVEDFESITDSDQAPAVGALVANAILAAGFRRPRHLDREQIARTLAADDADGDEWEWEVYLSNADAVIAVIEGQAS